MLVILKNINMDNQVEWIMIKKVTAKENRKELIKMIGLGILWFIGSIVFMILIFEIMVWFWESTLIGQLSKFLRSWI